MITLWCHHSIVMADLKHNKYYNYYFHFPFFLRFKGFCGKLGIIIFQPKQVLVPVRYKQLSSTAWFVELVEICTLTETSLRSGTKLYTFLK